MPVSSSISPGSHCPSHADLFLAVSCFFVSLESPARRLTPAYPVPQIGSLADAACAALSNAITGANGGRVFYAPSNGGANASLASGSIISSISGSGGGITGSGGGGSGGSTGTGTDSGSGSSTGSSTDTGSNTGTGSNSGTGTDTGSHTGSPTGTDIGGVDTDVDRIMAAVRRRLSPAAAALLVPAASEADIIATYTALQAQAVPRNQRFMAVCGCVCARALTVFKCVIRRLAQFCFSFCSRELLKCTRLSSGCFQML
jgi:hypothetical protein